MKKSTIKELFHGFRHYMEDKNMLKVDKDNTDLIYKSYVELKEKLTPELLTLHEKIVDAMEDNWYKEVKFYFTEGFKLGLNIGIECTETNI